MPGSATFVFADPDEFRASFLEAAVGLTVAGHGDFHARLTRIELQRIQLLSCSEVLPGVAHISLKPQVACFVFPSQEAGPATLDGAKVVMGDIMFWSQGQRFYARTPADFHWGCILFNPEILDRRRRTISHDPVVLPEFGCEATPPRSAMRRLLRLHHRAVTLALTAPDSIRDEGPAEDLEQLVIEAMLACLASENQRRFSPSQRKRSELMNRFWDILEADPDRVLHVSELCAALGVPDRTLRVCCDEYLGMSPIKYLRLRRLNRVRRALLHADPDESIVREIAALYGFPEHGRLSAIYRKTFGELPSATLRRLPED